MISFVYSLVDLANIVLQSGIFPKCTQGGFLKMLLKK